MKNFSLFSYVLFFFLLFGEIYQDEIVELNEINFQEKLSHQDYTIILFFTSYCSHVSEIIENLNEVSSAYYSSNTQVKFFKINVLKAKNLTKSLNIRGYPSIKYFNRSCHSFFDWKFDVTKGEMKYLIDLIFFNKIPHYNSLEKLKGNKAKFQLFFIGNISEEKDIYAEFKNFSNQSDYMLYNFASTDISSSILSYFRIPEEEAINNSFILLKRKYDHFDKRIKLVNETKNNFIQAFEMFFSNYSHPIYIEDFNHRIRNYFIESSVISLGIFYRKKTKIYDSFILSLFKNMTRNYILELIHKETEIFDVLQFNPKKIVFTFLDSEEYMVRRLIFFMGYTDKDMPLIAAYQISKMKKRVYSFDLGRYIQEFNFKQILIMLLSAFDESNKAVNFKPYFKHQIKPNNSKVYDIEPNSIQNFLKLYYPKAERSMHVIEYSANFCLQSKKLTILIEKLAKSEQKFYGVYIYFGRMQLYGSDLTSGVEKIPLLRLFINKEKIVDIELNDYTEKTVIQTIEEHIKKDLDEIGSIPVKRDL